MNYFNKLGRPLTNNEVDFNFQNLALRLGEPDAVLLRSVKGQPLKNREFDKNLHRLAELVDWDVDLVMREGVPLTSVGMDANFAALDAAVNRKVYGAGPYPVMDSVFAGASFLDSRITFTRADPSTYIEDGRLKTAPADAPVFEDGAWRLRPQETNLLLNSDGANPTTVYGGWERITPVLALSPYGDLRNITELKVVSTTGNAYVRYGGTSGGDPAKPYSGSIFVRTDDEPFEIDVMVNLVGGYQRRTVGNSWMRINRDVAANGTEPYRFMDLKVVPGTIGKKMQVACVQLNVGGLAPYIPTTSSPVTRPADNASIQGAAFAEVFNHSEGAVIVHTQDFLPYATAYPNVVRLAAGSGTQLQILIVAAPDGGGYSAWVPVNGTNVATNINLGPRIPGPNKFAIAWRDGTIEYFRNGQKRAAQATGIDMSLVNRYEFMAGFLLGANRRDESISFFRTRPTDAFLESLTA